MALESEVNRREVLKVSHGNIKLLKGLILHLLVKSPDPKEALPVHSLMRRMVQNLLVPMRMPLFRYNLRKNDILRLWRDLTMLGPSKLNVT